MAVFRVFDGRELVGEFFFDEGPVTVGRHPKSDICVSQDVVSRHHAVIKKNGKTWSVEKTEGRNGIFVNGQYCDFQILKPKDTIEVGHTIIQFSETEEMRAAAKRRENHEPGAAFYRSMDEVMSMLKQTEDIDVDGDDISWDAPTQPLGHRPQAFMDEEYEEDESNSSTVMLTIDQVAQRHGEYETELRTHVSWKDADGKRQLLEVSREPIVLGRGRDAHIVIQGGLGIGNRFALIRQTDQGPCVERCSRLVSVKVNGESIKGPMALSENDMITIYETNIVFHRELFG